MADPSINERQKNVLLQIYDSFRKENGFDVVSDTGAEVHGAADAESRIGADAESGAVDESGAGTDARGPRTAGGSDADPPLN